MNFEMLAMVFFCGSINTAPIPDGPGLPLAPPSEKIFNSSIILQCGVMDEYREFSIAIHDFHSIHSRQWQRRCQFHLRPSPYPQNGREKNRCIFFLLLVKARFLDRRHEVSDVCLPFTPRQSVQCVFDELK